MEVKMRDLRFRVWDKKEKKMSLYRSDLIFHWYRGKMLDRRTLDEKEDIIIMQYTGLKDKNGKKIFEGDVIKSKGRKGGSLEAVVKWQDEEAGYFPFCIDWDYGNQSYNDCFDIPEIIGNIYENPELKEK
jgi:hypothetical protein